METLKCLWQQAWMFLVRLWHWPRRNARWIVLIGGPGAGKGTMASMLGPALGIPHLSMGDVFRREIAANTKLGQEVKGYVDAGTLVPDDVTVATLTHELDSPEFDGGAVLDGFPRTLNQAKLLEELLARCGNELEVVLLLEVPEEDLIERLSNRRVCSNKSCGKIYHLTMAPPQVSEKCDACGQALYQRGDDVPEQIKTRLQIFREQSGPLCDYFEDSELLDVIQSTNAMTKDHVFNEILWAVNG